MAGSSGPGHWFDFDFFRNLNTQIMESVPEDSFLKKSFLGGNEVTDFHHVWMARGVFVVLVYFGLSFKRGFSRADREVAVPDAKFNMRSFFEVVCDYTFGTMAGIMGEKAARFFLPFIGTLRLLHYVFESLWLDSRLLPATDSLNTHASVFHFGLYRYPYLRCEGERTGAFRTHDGTVWWLAPLIFPIELIGHLARPVSLALRLAEQHDR